MPIEVILKQPVEGLGAEADIVKVKPGYARNFLIPRNIAAVATSASKRQIEELRRKRAEREAQEMNLAQEFAGKLNKATLTFQMQTGGESKVFGSVTTQDIVTRLKEMGIEIEKKKVSLPQAIKTLGETQVSINLGHGVQAKLKVILTSPTLTEEEEASERSSKKKFDKAPAKRTGKKSE